MNKNMEIKIGDFGISRELDTYKTYLLTTKKLGSEYYVAPEILDNGKYNEKSDLWSLGCIIYELFNLSIYFKDKFLDRIKKIDPDLYNYKWQGLIDSLLEKEYTKRLDINQVILFLEDYQKNNNNNKDNLIRGEIFIDKDHINKDIRIINSFENTKREKKWLDNDNDWKYKNEKEIKENIEIRINGSLIEFRYYYKFKKEGKNIIEYKSLEEFQKATPRKITLHILSKNIEDCSSFVRKLSNKRIKNGRAELLETDIIKKENLDSNQLMINQLDNTLIKEEKNFFGENLNSQNIDYKFFLFCWNRY
jgi:serine/threonine protein kinase